MTITCGDKNIGADLPAGGKLALYSVPEEYSGDGLYLALWAGNELEPVPACANAAPLLRLESVADSLGNYAIIEKIKAEGVAYAED